MISFNYNLHQCGIHILFVLSVVDGHYHELEQEIIYQYIQKNTDRAFDFAKERAFYENLDSQEIPILFDKLARRFAELSSMEERYQFLHVALSLVMADGSIADEENLFFSTLSRIWGIDLNHFFTEVQPAISSQWKESAL